MNFSKKGVNWGAAILVISFISMIVILIVSALIQTGAGSFYSPSNVVDYYKNLFSKENLKQPFVLAITFFVPFISTFAMTWAFLGILPIFRDKYRYPNADRSSAVLALGISLYTMPAMNFMITAFFPWSLAFAAIMIAIGLIAKALNWGITPFVETTESMVKAGQSVQEALKRGETEKKKKEEYEKLKQQEERRLQDLANSWNSLLKGYHDYLKKVPDLKINENVKKFFSRTKDTTLSRSWVELCDNLNHLEKERKRAMGFCESMREALQTPKEFRNLFKENFMAAGMLKELQDSLKAMEEYFNVVIRAYDKVLSRLKSGRFSSDVVPYIKHFQDCINGYTNFFNFKRAPANDLEALRTQTIKTLQIQI